MENKLIYVLSLVTLPHLGSSYIDMCRSQKVVLQKKANLHSCLYSFEHPCGLLAEIKPILQKNLTQVLILNLPSIL